MNWNVVTDTGRLLLILSSDIAGCMVFFIRRNVGFVAAVLFIALTDHWVSSPHALNYDRH